MTNEREDFLEWLHTTKIADPSTNEICAWIAWQARAEKHNMGVDSSDLLSLQGLLGGHGVWTPELEKELVEWINARPRFGQVRDQNI